MRYLFFIFLSMIIAGCENNTEKATTGAQTQDVELKNDKEVSFSQKSTLVLSPELLKDGLDTGTYSVERSQGKTKNLLVVYFIFEKDFEKEILVKAFNQEGLEIGRTVKLLKGIKGEANYTEIQFPERTSIEPKGKITIE